MQFAIGLIKNSLKNSVNAVQYVSHMDLDKKKSVEGDIYQNAGISWEVVLILPQKQKKKCAGHIVYGLVLKALKYFFSYMHTARKKVC